MGNKSAQKYEKIEPKQQQAKHQRRPNMFLQIESPLYCNFWINTAFAHLSLNTVFVPQMTGDAAPPDDVKTKVSKPKFAIA